MIELVAKALRPLPQVGDAAKARVLIAVAAERERGREEVGRGGLWRGAGWWLERGAGLAAAVAMATFLLRAPVRTPVRTRVGAIAVARAAGTPATPTAQLAGHDAAAEMDVARQSVQLVLRAPSASRVRVVGDFNGWDGERAPMTRDSSSGLWSVTLSLRPGRHVYAFVVDDTLWMRDLRAPASSDADFGRPGSVM